MTDLKRRRGLLTLLASSFGVASLQTFAQGKRRDAPARLAILDDAPEIVRADYWGAFRQRLKELGYVEGRDVIVEMRSAGGAVDRLPTLTAQIVASKPDVFVVVTTTVALAAKQATSDIPIVAMGPADPVKSGLVASLARPGGNLTGVSQNQAMIAGKWLELIRELSPRAKSLAYLTDLANPGEMAVFRQLEEQARSLRIDAQAMDGVSRSNVDQAFAAIKRSRVDAIVVATTSSVLPQKQQIIDGAAQLGLPAVYARQEYPEAGGLLSYGTDTRLVFLRGADYVHLILQGTKPSELPFEMAAKFTMVVNLKTARTLGLKIPQSILVRADQVIE